MRLNNTTLQGIVYGNLTGVGLRRPDMDAQSRVDALRVVNETINHPDLLFYYYEDSQIIVDNKWDFYEVEVSDSYHIILYNNKVECLEKGIDGDLNVCFNESERHFLLVF